jgi:hypothetical protein
MLSCRVSQNLIILGVSLAVSAAIKPERSLATTVRLQAAGPTFAGRGRWKEHLLWSAVMAG